MSVENEPESRSDGVVGIGYFAFPSSRHWSYTFSRSS